MQHIFRLSWSLYIQPNIESGALLHTTMYAMLLKIKSAAGGNFRMGNITGFDSPVTGNISTNIFAGGRGFEPRIALQQRPLDVLTH